MHSWSSFVVLQTCTSCCTESYCNERVPHNHHTALMYSSLENGASSSRDSSMVAIFVVVLMHAGIRLIRPWTSRCGRHFLERIAIVVETYSLCAFFREMSPLVVSESSAMCCAPPVTQAGASCKRIWTAIMSVCQQCQYGEATLQMRHHRWYI